MCDNGAQLNMYLYTADLTNTTQFHIIQFDLILP